MVLGIAASAASLVPRAYYVPIALSLLAIYIVHAFSQGRKTTRERDMHARVVLVTGGFTPLGLTLLNQLAERGAHIIALSPQPIDSPDVDTIIDLLRSTTKNEHIFAEHCDLTSPASIRSFCTRFLTGKDQRLDCLIFAHEYELIGSLFSSRPADMLETQRQAASLATFLIITLLLPVLLVAPVERDIRIISVVNPFYAAATPAFSSAVTKEKSLLQAEGKRSLRTVVLTRHLQRVLDALNSGAQVPKADANTVPVVSQKTQKSNIVAVSVSPGISRSDTVAPFLDASSFSQGSRFGITLYFLLLPILRVITKSPFSALQTVLHVLFLPTPFKAVAMDTASSGQSTKESLLQEEILMPGSLYSECAKVRLHVDVLLGIQDTTQDNAGSSTSDTVKIEDDGELGGEKTGRLVWESYEIALKEWEKNSPKLDTDEKASMTEEKSS